MKNIFTFLALSFSIITNLIGQNPISCITDAFLFQQNDIYTIDLASGYSTLAKVDATPGNINAVAYNPTDDYIWGALSTPDQAIVRIDNNYNAEVHIIENLGSSNAYIGGIDNNGIYHMKPGGSEVTTIDLDPNSVDYLIKTGSYTLSTGLSIADWAFNPIDGMIYTAEKNTNQLIRITPFSGAVQKLGAISAMAGNNYTYGAVYFDNVGNLYISTNQTGTIYKVSNTQEVYSESDIVSSIFAFGPSSNSNDGARCPQAPVPQEICDNGIDDDGDGLVDCDDPSCGGTDICPDLPTSPGSEGGLESNGRLSEKISYRNFVRAKNNVNRDPSKNEMDLFTKQSLSWTLETIATYIPENVISGTENYISTPSDLLQITNAKEVFAIDIFEEDDRLASVLAIHSDNGVYEHTKYICDRLGGSEILDILSIPIDGENTYPVVKFKRKNGNIEYNCNFSVREGKADDFILENHWNIDRYTKGEDYYNFQIWASNVSHLSAIVNGTLDLLKVDRKISDYKMSGVPDLYVKKGQYYNGDLYFTVENKDEANMMYVNAIRTRTETQESEKFKTTYQLDRKLTVQDKKVETGGVLNLGMTIHGPKGGVEDAIFIADGAWGIEKNNSNHIQEFLVSSSSFEDEADFWVERNIHLEAETEEGINVYRSFNPAYRSEDLSMYNTLSFLARGEGTLHVTMVKDGIVNWNDQLRTSIELSQEEQRVDISKAMFLNSDEEELEWDDIKMLVFTVVDNSENTEVELDLGQIYFTERTSENPFQNIENKAVVYPNPVIENASIMVKSSNFQSYKLQILNMNGEKLQSSIGEVVAGYNQLTLKTSALPMGIYFYSLQTDDGQLLTGKFTKI